MIPKVSVTASARRKLVSLASCNIGISSIFTRNRVGLELTSYSSKLLKHNVIYIIN